MLLVDAAWHGLWPIEEAIRHGKPLLSVPAFDADPQHVERVLKHLNQSEARVQFALPWRHTPASIRLRRLLRTRLGAIKLLLCQHHGVGTLGHVTALDWCLHLMQAEPTRVQSLHSDAIRTLLLDFRGGAAQVSLIHGSDPPQFHATIHTEGGEVRMRHPHRLSWRRHQTTSHMILTGKRTAEERVLRRFHRMVVSGQSDPANLAAVQAAYRLL